MCRVHPDIVRAVKDRTGGRERIMQRFGISWNSWMKIAAGDPVRRSVAERFRDRVARTSLIESGGNGDMGMIEINGTGEDVRPVD